MSNVEDTPFVITYYTDKSSWPITSMEILKGRNKQLPCCDCATLEPMQPCEACVNREVQYALRK